MAAFVGTAESRFRLGNMVTFGEHCAEIKRAVSVAAFVGTAVGGFRAGQISVLHERRTKLESGKRLVDFLGGIMRGRRKGHEDAAPWRSGPMRPQHRRPAVCPAWGVARDGAGRQPLRARQPVRPRPQAPLLPGEANARRRAFAHQLRRPADSAIGRDSALLQRRRQPRPVAAARR